MASRPVIIRRSVYDGKPRNHREILDDAIRDNDMETFLRMIKAITPTRDSLRIILRERRLEMLIALVQREPQIAFKIFDPVDADDLELLVLQSDNFYDRLAEYYHLMTDRLAEYHHLITDRHYGRIMELIFGLRSHFSIGDEDLQKLVHKIFPGMIMIYEIEGLYQTLDDIEEDIRTARENIADTRFRRTRNALQLAYAMLLNEEAMEGIPGFDIKLKKFREEEKITRDQAKDLLAVWSVQKRKFLLMRRFDPKERRPDGSFYQRTD
jgi:hypothetical protein